MASTTLSVQDIANFPNLVSDVLYFENLPISPPAKIPSQFRSPHEYYCFLGRIQNASQHIKRYAHVGKPLIKTIQESGFSPIAIDAANALLLQGEACVGEPLSICSVTCAVQKFVASLYKDFIHCENQVIPFCQKPPHTPLFSWGSGPATWTEMQTKSIGIKDTAIVHLPPGNACGGIFAWTTLGHEVVGHDASTAAQIQNELHHHTSLLFPFTSQQITELVSDVLGTLHLGPAGAIGLIGYLKGKGTLGTQSSLESTHPPAIFRAAVVAEVVNQLGFGNWAQLTKVITINSWPKFPRGIHHWVIMGPQLLSFDATLLLAGSVAHTIMNTPLQNLGGKSLMQIRAWDATDQNLAEQTASCLAKPRMGSAPAFCRAQSINQANAKHILAGATLASLKAEANTDQIFQNMITFISKLK